MSTAEVIRNTLNEKLQASYVEIIDDSGMHAGHKAAGGGGHFTVIVVSPQFAGVNSLDRRRLVYGSLDEYIQGTNTSPKLIHALQIKTFAPDEWRR